MTLEERIDRAMLELGKARAQTPYYPAVLGRLRAAAGEIEAAIKIITRKT